MSLSILTVLPNDYTIEHFNNFIQNCLNNNNININLEIICIILQNNIDINIDIYNNIPHLNIKLIKTNKDYNLNYLLNIALVHTTYNNILYSNIDTLFTNNLFDFINKNHLKDNYIYIPRTIITSTIDDILSNIITIKDLAPNYNLGNLNTDLNNNLSLEFSNEELLESNKNIFLNGANISFIMTKNSFNSLSGFPEEVKDFNIDVFLYNLISKGFIQVILPYIISSIQVKPATYNDTFIKARYMSMTYFNEFPPDASYDFYSNERKIWKRYRAHNSNKVFRGYKPNELVKENKELQNKLKELEQRKQSKKNVIDGDSIKSTILESEKLILKKELQLQKIKTKIQKLKQIEALKAELEEDSSDE
tara:strand:+ start:9533 stop:10624 length:1092 start_codon:yes stop_codon:yes gene_type:complete